MDRLIDLIKADELGEIHLNENMKFHTTMRVGGQIRCLYIPNNVESLVRVLTYVKANKLKYKVLGRGSNTVFPELPMNGIVIKISNVLDYMEINADQIIVGAGYSLIKLAKELSKQGYQGLEFAGGIPGTIGGATTMNAGAHLDCMAKIINHVKIINEANQIVTLTNEQCCFHYRSSI